jgi:hypothetical protein
MKRIPDIVILEGMLKAYQKQAEEYSRIVQIAKRSAEMIKLTTAYHTALKRKKK